MISGTRRYGQGILTGLMERRKLEGGPERVARVVQVSKIHDLKLFARLEVEGEAVFGNMFTPMSEYQFKVEGKAACPVT